MHCMQAGTPSRTALGAAAHRAAHQTLEQGRVFSDPLAVRILGPNAEAIIAEVNDRPSSARMRLFIAARTRFAEDALKAALERGLKQVVILAAGLDTSAYRNDWPGVRVFEVDHVDTQAWKRGMLAQAGISAPATLTYASIDFERQTLEEALADAGFDPSIETFFTWMGCTPYLTEDAIWATCAYVAGLPGGGHIVFDYALPAEETGEERAAREADAARVANLGEPWISFFTPDAMHAKLRELGFTAFDEIGRNEIFERYFGMTPPTDAQRGGARVIRASTR